MMCPSFFRNPGYATDYRDVGYLWKALRYYILVVLEAYYARHFQEFQEFVLPLSDAMMTSHPLADLRQR